MKSMCLCSGVTVVLSFFGLLLLCLANDSLQQANISLSDINVLSDSRNPTDKLQHLHVMFRHGDRTPVDDIINDYSQFQKLWPSGRGQLTEQGIIQEFKLGQWIRQKYNDFIPQSYNGSYYHMRSTDIDRTLMSAQAFSAGLYFNYSSPLHVYGIDWRPIPVHTVSQESDVLLSTAPCPCLNALRKAQMNSNKSLNFEELHRPLFNLLVKELGKKIDRFNLWEVVDTLICMKAHNIPLPSWCTERVFQELLEVATFYWNMEFTTNAEILRLEIGVFLSTFVSHITSVVRGFGLLASNPYKLSSQHSFIYSAHDTDVSYLLAALGVYDGKLVEYSSAVVLEVLGPDLPGVFSDYRLRIRYKRGYPDEVGEYLVPPPCHNQTGEAGCPLNKLMDYIKPFLLKSEEFDAVCAVDNSPPYSDSIKVIPFCRAPKHTYELAYILIGVMISVCVIGVLLFTIVYYLRRNRALYSTFPRSGSVAA